MEKLSALAVRVCLVDGSKAYGQIIAIWPDNRLFLVQLDDEPAEQVEVHVDDVEVLDELDDDFHGPDSQAIRGPDGDPGMFDWIGGPGQSGWKLSHWLSTLSTQACFPPVFPLCTHAHIHPLIRAPVLCDTAAGVPPSAPTHTFTIL